MASHIGPIWRGPFDIMELGQLDFHQNAAANRALAQVLPEELNRPCPRQFRRCLVVSRSGIIVESMLRAWIEMRLVALLVRKQCGLIRRPRGVDAFVDFGVMD